MTVTNVVKDRDTRTMTMTSELDGPPETVWRLIAEPRLLERWWGPPEWPATFPDYTLTPGEGINYFMTGPDGEKSNAWWTVLSVDPPRVLEVADGFADESGAPNDSLPTMTMRFEVSGIDGGRSRMDVTATFPTLEAMEQVLAMGMEEGARAGAAQIDAVLADVMATA
jgi:uncharacterized protein YndB with AHSA1/START domain